MQITREQFDRDRHEGRENYSKLPTESNRYNMYCSNCHASFYVDKSFYDEILTSMEEGLDNPFICDDCQDEMAELESWQGH
jgi:hypothetical protein